MAKGTFGDFLLRSSGRSTAECFIDPGQPDRLFGAGPTPSRGWALFCGYDERNYAVVIQKAADDREIMVRVGCRWKSLKAARSHWVSAARNSNASERRTAKQILMLIGMGVSRARNKGWTRKTFNSTPRRKANA